MIVKFMFILYVILEIMYMSNHIVWEHPGLRYLRIESRLDTRNIFSGFRTPFIMYAQALHYYVFTNHCVSRLKYESEEINNTMS